MLVTKILQPAYRHPLIARNRLTDRLDEASGTRVIGLTAPGGFGKSTLLTQWRRALVDRGCRVGWVTLDAADNDGIQLLSYCVAALRQAGCILPTGSLALMDPGNDGWKSEFLSAFVNDLAEIDEEVYLVLDDFHTVTNAAIHELVSQIVHYAPDNFHLVLSSRSAIPLPLRRLHLQRHIFEISSRVLRFSFSETHQYLGTVTRETVTGEQCRLVHDATDGWPAGIQLLMTSVNTKSPASSHIDRDGAVFLRSFLDSQLESLPQDRLDILLKLSLLDRFCSKLCEDVLNVTNAASMLDELSADGLLLVPLDHPDLWYRFHGIFRDHLRQRLTQNILSNFESLSRRAQIWTERAAPGQHSDPSALLKDCQRELSAIDLPSFHLRVSIWFERNGHLTDAVHHAFNAADDERALELVDRCAMAVLADGQLPTVLVWSQSIPPERLATRWRIRLARFWAWALGAQHHRATAELAELASAVDQPGGIKSFEYAVCKAALASLACDIPAALTLLRQWPPDGDDFHNAVACNVLIYAMASSGQHETLRDVTAWVQEQKPAAMRGFTLAYYQALTGWLHFIKGNVVKAEEVLWDSLRYFEEEAGRASPSACLVTGYLAEVLYETNNLVALESLLAGRLDVLNEKVIFESSIRAYLAAARLRFAKSDHEGAFDLLERLKYFGNAIGIDPPAAVALAERVRMEVFRGNLVAAQSNAACLEKLCPVRKQNEPITSLCNRLDAYVLCLLSRARMAIARGVPALAHGELDRLYELSIDVRFDLVSKIRLVRCLALYSCGDSRAIPDMVSLLILTSPSGLIRIYVDEGAICKLLIEQAQSQLDDRTARYSTRILAAFDDVHESGPDLTVVESQQYALSLRELDILALLAQGMPNKRIALSLNISAETVKWYLKRIFSKLGVNDRVHAIDKARREGLTERLTPAFT